MEDHPDAIPSLATAIFKCLHDMDQEANVTVRGNTTGLNWYGAFANPNQKRPATEPSWTKRLAALLPACGVVARSEERYPRPAIRTSQKCDLLAEPSESTCVWIEVKGAWKDWSVRQGDRQHWFYRSYLLHPLEAGLDETKTHTVPFDFRRLESLAPADGTHAGLLLVSFDSDAHPIAEDVDVLVRLARLSAPLWTTFHTSWTDTYLPNCHVRCWLWIRPIT